MLIFLLWPLNFLLILYFFLILILLPSCVPLVSKAKHEQFEIILPPTCFMTIYGQICIGSIHSGWESYGSYLTKCIPRKSWVTEVVFSLPMTLWGDQYLALRKSHTLSQIYIISEFTKWEEHGISKILIAFPLFLFGNEYILRKTDSQIPFP